MPCNLFTGSGLSLDIAGSFSLAWGVGAILFFIAMFAGKWLCEFVSFNKWLGLIGGLVPWFIVITFFCSIKFAFLAGFVGIFIGGILGAVFFGGDENY